MLRNKTVFVIGAGASHEYGLPIGTTLAQEISRKLDVWFDHYQQTRGDQELFDSFRNSYTSEANDYQQAGWLIRDGIILANSIDDFLDVHHHDERVVKLGKAAITKCILEAERSSRLHFKVRRAGDTIDFAACADTWLVKLMRLLGRGLPFADRAKIFDQCSFVVFNYDRCIEHFFIHALSRFYRIETTESAEIVSTARIYHPYGTPGPLPGAPNGIAFGADRAVWSGLSDRIKTYTETVEADAIKLAVVEAKQIVFLGFAYHDQNLQLLADNQSLQLKSVIGTAYQRSDSDVSAIREQIAQWINPNLKHLMDKQIHITNGLTASQTFDHFSKSL